MQPGVRHLVTADAGKNARRATRSRSARIKRAAQPVAGDFRRDQEDGRIGGARRPFDRRRSSGSRGLHAHSEYARRIRLANDPAGSAMMAAPATTASPASLARATPSTVLGPIVGRSKRWSWPILAALTSTPMPGLV